MHSTKLTNGYYNSISNSKPPSSIQVSFIVPIDSPFWISIPHNSREWKGWELLRPFAPVDTALGGQLGEGAEAVHHVWLGGQVGEGAEAAHQVWLGGSLTPVQIMLSRGRVPIIINGIAGLSISI